MPKKEREIEKPDNIVKVVKKILEINEKNQQNQQNQQGEGLKIFTPNQMLSRLPISLAELKAGNNSDKLKNEMRQCCILFIVQKIWLSKCTITW